MNKTQDTIIVMVSMQLMKNNICYQLLLISIKPKHDYISCCEYNSINEYDIITLKSFQ